MRPSFSELLERKQAEGKFLCVGLDSDGDILPHHIAELPGLRMVEFNHKIMDATADIVSAWKLQLAFYLKQGSIGLEVLENSFRYGHARYPDIPMILDAKFGDTPNTDEAYVHFTFELLRADAVTVNPLVGHMALEPFLYRKDKGIFALCHTSNEGAGEFQDMDVSGDVVPGDYMPLYKFIAHRVSRGWNRDFNCGLVVGALYLEQLQEARSIARDLPILIPGIGDTGVDLEQVVKTAGKNKIINASRRVICASKGVDYAEAARKEALRLHEAITKFNV